MSPYFQKPRGIFLCNPLSEVVTVQESEAEKKIASGAVNVWMLARFSNCDSVPKVHHKNAFFDRFLKGGNQLV